jgi:hypothetical protein
VNHDHQVQKLHSQSVDGARGGAQTWRSGTIAGSRRNLRHVGGPQWAGVGAFVKKKGDGQPVPRTFESAKMRLHNARSRIDRLLESMALAGMPVGDTINELCDSLDKHADNLELVLYIRVMVTEEQQLEQQRVSYQHPMFESVDTGERSQMKLATPVEDPNPAATALDESEFVFYHSGTATKH